MGVERGVGVTDQASAAGVADVRVRERGSPAAGFFTTLTADPGTSAPGTFALTAYPANWPTSGSFKLRVEDEVVLVTGGHGTLSVTATRAQDGTTNAAHAIGKTVAMVVAEQYIIPVRTRVVTGVYLTSFLGTVALAADTPPAGKFWLINPVGSGVFMALRRAEFMSASGTAVATPTSPRITLRRVTFTGTASGATQTPAKGDSTMPSSVGSFRTANTGLTLTQGADFFSFLPFVALTAVGAAAATAADWNPDDDGMIVLAAGEGVFCFQQDAGTTGDTRRWVMNVAHEEFTLP